MVESPQAEVQLESCHIQVRTSLKPVALASTMLHLFLKSIYDSGF